MFGTQQNNYIQQTIDCFHGKKTQRKKMIFLSCKIKANNLCIVNN
jgi:hypothetical protein